MDAVTVYSRPVAYLEARLEALRRTPAHLIAIEIELTAQILLELAKEARRETGYSLIHGGQK